MFAENYYLWDKEHEFENQTKLLKHITFLYTVTAS